jgi:hypothetical protein
MFGLSADGLAEMMVRSQNLVKDETPRSYTSGMAGV